MSENCDVIGFFLIYGQFAATWKLEFLRMVYKNAFSLIITFVLQNLKRTKKSQTQLS